jgi:hypothetical protein
MSADKTQVGGTHYTDMAVQPWDAMRAWMSPEQFCGYLLGTAVAYLARVNVTAPGKGGIDDIEKARHVLAKLAETWNYRIFREFPKEVMQSDPGHDPGDRIVTTPAVSESAAGGHLTQSLCDKAASAWPGPDWSQAPDGCVGWVHGANKNARWIFGEGKFIPEGEWVSTNHPLSVPAPHFNYPGHWHDSLRKRPEARP